MKTIIQQINDELFALSPAYLHKVLIYAKALRQIKEEEKGVEKA